MTNMSVDYDHFFTYEKYLLVFIIETC